MSRHLILLATVLLVLASCGKVYHLADVQSRSYRIEKASYPVDVKVAATIEPYKLQLDKTMNEVIGYCEKELVKGKPTSTLTNWFADALQDEAQQLSSEPVDFAVQNYGGIRMPVFGKGPVTVGKMYELMPFDNVMYILKLKGTDVKTFFDRMAESGGWPVSRNVSFRIEYGKAENIRIKGVALDTNAVYTAAIPDYIANGGDNMTFLKALPSVNTGMLLRDMLIKNVRDLQAKGLTINPQEDQRITQ